MKETSDVVACVVDFSMFMPVARRLAEQFKKVYYTTPTEKGFQEIGDFILGDGLPDLIRIDDYEDPSVFSEIDLFVFPYILYGGKQRLYESLGKAVWGARHADELERLKGKFYRTLEEIGLEVPPHVEIKGLANLRAYLKEHKNVFVKMSKFRGTMDTWKSKDYQQSLSYLDLLAVKLGPFQDLVTFYVLDEIKTDIEGGIDTYCIDGRWPNEVVLGYEKKNETYLATVKPFDRMPKIFTDVNRAIGPVLADYNYRQFFSTEIRVKDGVSYFIDPTCFSEDTEILSESGWKRFPQLAPSEKVCTLSPSGCIEYQEPSSHIACRFDGEMVLMTNRKRDLELLVTPNHSVWGIAGHGDRLQEFRADALPYSLSIPRSGHWSGIESREYIVPEYNHNWIGGRWGNTHRSKQAEAKRVPMDQWLKFLAIYLAEGSKRKWQVSIAQTSRKEEVREILAALPFKWKEHPKAFVCSDVQLSAALPDGDRYTKCIPAYVKALSARQIDLFLTAYCLGDGYSRRGQRSITTPSRKTADDLQECFLKAGSLASVTLRNFKGKPCAISGGKYICHHDSFLLRERSKFKRFYVEGWKNSRHRQYLSRVPYHGMVYDVTVPNHIVFVRRNGKPCFSGNCRTASPAGEEMLDLFGNIGDIFWHGAHGELVQPEITARFAGEAYIHWTGEKQEWKFLRVPEEFQDRVKIYGSAYVEDGFWWPPDEEEVIGCIVGLGDTPTEVIDSIKESVEALGDANIDVRIASFVDLISEIEKAEEEGIDFSNKPLPEPAVLLSDKEC